MSDLERLRHSCAHVLATAISRIWPDAQFAAGPPVEGGFYYDVDLKHRISPDDFEQIEAEMKKVVKENARFEKAIVSRDEALALAKSGRLASVAEREVESVFKVDLLEAIPEDEEISIYKNGDGRAARTCGADPDQPPALWPLANDQIALPDAAPWHAGTRANGRCAWCVGC